MSLSAALDDFMVVLDVTIVGNAFHIIAAALAIVHSPGLCRGLATTRLLPSVEYGSTSHSIRQSLQLPMFWADMLNRSELHCYIAMRRKYSVRQQMGLPPIHIETEIFSYSLMMSYFYNRRRLPTACPAPTLLAHNTNTGM